MLGTHGRGLAKRVFTAPARALARMGVRANHVTIAGTTLTVILSAALLAPGYWAAGAIALGVVLFADSLDGTIARLTGESSHFGAYLDATLDRVGDGAVFGALVFSFTNLPAGWMRTWLLIAGLITMVGVATVPYAKARAEAEGAHASVGIAERTDRLVIALVAAGLTGFGLSMWLVVIAMTWLAIATAITVFHRTVVVYQQLQAR
ncbi:phosphatidylinositol phosphate synthase [Gleimia hominis]|uniref:phosphatidylinositol phosphate synthase n=1 Tax=Gleimia hominis TaxID=595468 RepID=UPI000C809491|nr:CDP-alcohol phosphatidyltransferase family protein [Gleimia hominis]WIK65124.1 CDP-alcohol phosphatidyltransferase family protein [Gleimia hominis]